MSDTEHGPEAAGDLVARVEAIMRRRQEGTETLRKLWNDGELPVAALPCHNACEGDIVVYHEDVRLRGFCPVYMEEPHCILVEKERRELEARMLRAGIGRRYHRPDVKMLRARDVVEEYLANLDQNLANGRGLILTGDVGVGKTMTLAYLGKELIRNDVGVWVVLWPELLRLLEDREQRKATVERALKVKVLMLDDFGSGDMAPWVVGILESIVEKRNGKMFPTMVSTNIPAGELTKSVGYRRMVDRWRESNTLVRIGGKSMRHD